MRVPQKDGKFKDVALTEQQLDHVTQLVKDAVGFDESRGDNVNVVNASFTTEPAAPEGELETTAVLGVPAIPQHVEAVGWRDRTAGVGAVRIEAAGAQPGGPDASHTADHPARRRRKPP